MPKFKPGPIIILSITALILVSLPTEGSQLEIFSWWTAGGEAEGLKALFETYRQNYQDVEITNATVAGGAGTNAKSVLKTRMLAGSPPDSFQVHAGAELINTWVKSEYLTPITDLWEQNNWSEVFPKKLINMISHGGEIYSVPLNIHRANLLWYNTRIFEGHDLEPPRTLEEFFEVAETLKQKGITPLALGTKNIWPVTHILETILATRNQGDFYSRLAASDLPWTDDRVIKSLEILKKMLEYTNDNHASLTWDQSCRLLLEDRAAMTIMGSWARGYFKANQAQPDKDYSVIPVPETSDYFIMVSDTFGLPKDAPHPENARSWLKLIGSRQGQQSANPRLGSIPARIDLNQEQANQYSQKQWQDYNSSRLLPSITHGAAFTNAFVSAINDEMGVFIYKQEVNKTARALEDKAADLGLRNPSNSSQEARKKDGESDNSQSGNPLVKLEQVAPSS